MPLDDLIVVAGAGGFIGGHLVAELRRDGYRRIRAVDVKPLDEWYQRFRRTSTTARSTCARRRRADEAVAGARDVYNLAADMGGMGFIENNKALCMLSVLINTHLLMAAARPRASSASSSLVRVRVRRRASRLDPSVTPLKEADAYPAMPEDGYGWEKLFSERMCRHFLRGLRPDHARRPLPQRLRPARHLGRRPREGAGGDLPQGDRGEAQRASTRSRSGATASRRAASRTSTTASTGTQDPDGQRRRASRSTSAARELVTINELVDIVEEIAGVKLERRYNLDAPQGRPRPQQRQHADPGAARLGAGDVARDGLEKTYRWIYDQMAGDVAGAARAAAPAVTQ